MSEETPSDLPEWTEEERLLLASADLDQPPEDSLRRTLRAAGAATAVAGGVAATHATASALLGKAGGSFAIVKWLALATCLGGAAIGLHTWQKHRIASEAPTASVVQAPAPRPPVLAPAEAPPPFASSEPAPSLPAAEEAAPSPDHPSPRPAARSTAAASASQPDLTRDIAALDAARQALRAGRAAEALAALDRYDAEFGKNGALRVEASVLRIEATARAGNRDRAQRLARTFLAHNSKSPYAARVKAILEQ